MKDAGKIVRLGPGRAPKAKVEENMDKLVGRLKYSIPVLRATVADSHLRNLILTQLIAQNVRDQRAVVVPEGTLAHVVKPEVFDRYRTALGGLTEKNAAEVEQKLAEMGIDGRGRPVGKAKAPPQQQGTQSGGSSRGRRG